MPLGRALAEHCLLLALRARQPRLDQIDPFCRESERRLVIKALDGAERTYGPAMGAAMGRTVGET